MIQLLKRVPATRSSSTPTAAPILRISLLGQFGNRCLPGSTRPCSCSVAVAGPLSLADLVQYEQQLEPARVQLGLEAFSALWAEGLARSLGDALSYAATEAMRGL